MNQIKTYLIKKLGGFTEEEVLSITNGKNETAQEIASQMLKNVRVSFRSDIYDELQKATGPLNVLSALVDYFCVQVGIPKRYNNGAYENLKDMIG